MHVLKLVMQLFLLCNSSGNEGPGQGVWVPQCIEPPLVLTLGQTTFIHSCFSSLDYNSLLHPSSTCPVRFVSLGYFVLVYVASLLGSTHYRANNSRKFEWLNRLWAFGYAAHVVCKSLALVSPRRVISCPSHWVRCWLCSEMKEIKKKKAAKMKEK